VLKARLTARATEDQAELETRLRNSFNEVMQYSRFKYVVVNEDLPAATRQIASIILAERQLLDRQSGSIQGILDSFDASRHQYC
jgi:guanylate kinase